ncbi:MAG: hypothetical protein JNM68_10120 [Dinghuibacter sp.]|nr:hypothetical protein [Dinghuibacter sp.]
MGKQTAIVIAALFFCCGAVAQNVSINLLVRNSGKVANNENVFLEVTLCNMDAAVNVPPYRLKAQVSAPASLVKMPMIGHELPPGWRVAAAKEGQLWLSNGTDTLGAGECRTLLVVLRAVSVGGPSTVSGNLLFANGVAPGNITGVPLPGDSPADNHSTSTVEVIRVLRK